jgi:DNA repair exonuclease SbcCD ATPase subunit
LDASPTTLIIGKNGHGKSTLLDALCFGLFGKPFRNITKGQLVNSVNGKACKVVVRFETEGKEYSVTRGIKPNLFEIHVDGKLLQQDAATKDYQKVLESQILKYTHKTFTQVVILGASSFTPFMKLPAGHRREVIEDILDIKIFSTMGSVLKEKVAEVKSSLADINLNISVLKGQIESQRALIEVIKKSKEDSTKESKDKIEVYNRRIEALEKDVSILETQSEEKNARLIALNEDIMLGQQVLSVINDLRYGVKQAEEELKFFKENGDCPTCKQNIDGEHKHDSIERLKATIEDLKQGEEDLVEKQLIYGRNVQEAKKLQMELQEIQIDRASIQSEIRSVKRNITETEALIREQAADTADIDHEKSKLKSLAASITTLLEEKIELTEKRNLQEVASTLLKDSGIKTNIVREYLPLMNKLINKYLQVQDSFIQFELDEQFEETIKSRYRDEFTYASFSEGERQRIDLSILFTWRQIARMKNSANTNLLILDEVMDGSLDDEGNDSAQDLINALAADGTHVFVVSHSVDKHIEKFNRVLSFEKKGNYSTMSAIKSS